jgi:SAM-dependent methyltransferase
MTAAAGRAGPPAADLAGAAMADYAAGRSGPLYLGTPDGHRHPHDLDAYFADPAALPEPERALLARAVGPVLDVGCGPARHARHLQQRGLHAVGLDRSRLALATARALGLRHSVYADALRDPLPAGIGTVLLLDGNLGLAGTVDGARRLLDRLAAAAAAGARLLVAGRAPRGAVLRAVQVRVEYCGSAGPWFSWLLLGLPAVVSLAAPAGWRLVAAAVAGHDYWACLELAGEGRS